MSASDWQRKDWRSGRMDEVGEWAGEADEKTRREVGVRPTRSLMAFIREELRFGAAVT